MIFAVYREISASLLLLGLTLSLYRAEQRNAATDESLQQQRWFPLREHRLRFAVMGVCSFGNVVGFIVGLNLTSAPNAAALQPCIPVLVVLISAVFRLERLTLWKALGVAIAAAGAALGLFPQSVFLANSRFPAVVLFDPDASGGSISAGQALAGNLILIGQCVSMALIYILQVLASLFSVSQKSSFLSETDCVQVPVGDANLPLLHYRHNINVSSRHSCMSCFMLYE